MIDSTRHKRRQNKPSNPFQGCASPAGYSHQQPIALLFQAHVFAACAHAPASQSRPLPHHLRHGRLSNGHLVHCDNATHSAADCGYAMYI